MAVAEVEERLFAAQALRSDLDAIWSTLREISLDPFQVSDGKMVENLFRRIPSRIISPMTIRGAWLAIAPVSGPLNNGHVALGLPGRLNEALRHFPMSFAVDEASGNLVVARDRTGIVLPGSLVISIETTTARDYLRMTMRAFDGQTPALIRSCVSGAGAWMSIAPFGVKPTYVLRWRDQAGAERESSISTNSISVTRDSNEPYSSR